MLYALKSSLMNSILSAPLTRSGAVISIFSIVLLALTSCSTKASAPVSADLSLDSPSEYEAVSGFPGEKDAVETSTMKEGKGEIMVDLSAEATGTNSVRLQLIAPDGATLDNGQVFVGGLAAVDENTISLYRKGPIDIEGEDVLLKSLPLGAFTLTVIAGDLTGISRLLLPIELPIEQEAVVHLEPGRTLRGRVLSEIGEPPNTPISLVVSIRESELHLPVDEDGNFSHSLPRNESIRVYAIGEGLASSTMRIGQDEDLEELMTLRLGPMVPISLKMKYADGQPVRGAPAVFVWNGLERVISTTDQRGMASFERVAPTRVTLEINYHALEIRVPLTLEDITSGTDVPPMIEVRLPPLGSLPGRVVGDDGQAIERGYISARPAVKGAKPPVISPESVLPESLSSVRPGTRVSSAPTMSTSVPIGPDGGFELMLPEGAWILRTMDGRSEAVTVEVVGGQTHEEVVIGPPSAEAVTDPPQAIARTGSLVTFEDGSPLAHHIIHCRPVGTGDSSSPDTQEEPIPKPARQASDAQSITEYAEEMMRYHQEIMKRAAESMPGQHRPLHINTRTNAEGEFSIDLDRSRLENVEWLSCKPNRPPLAVLSGGRVRVEGDSDTIVVHARPTLVGQILKPDGQPLPSFEIAVSKDMRETWKSVEDPQGRFSIPAPNSCTEKQCHIKVRSENYPQKAFTVPVDWRQKSVDVSSLQMAAGVWLSGRIDLSGVDISSDPVIVIASESILVQLSDERVFRLFMNSFSAGTFFEVAEDGEFRLGPIPFNRNFNQIFLYVVRPGIASKKHRLKVESLDMNVGTLYPPTP